MPLRLRAVRAWLKVLPGGWVLLSTNLSITINLHARHCGRNSKEGMNIMAKHGKKYQEALKLIEGDKLYQPQEALSLLKKINYVNFDPTVEVHMRLGVDPRHADQMVRGVAMLPPGTGQQAKALASPHAHK